MAEAAVAKILARGNRKDQLVHSKVARENRYDTRPRASENFFGLLAMLDFFAEACQLRQYIILADLC
jgi:hypothetical protein